jgi:hypothetical protein
MASMTRAFQRHRAHRGDNDIAEDREGGGDRKWHVKKSGPDTSVLHLHKDGKPLNFMRG